MNNAGEKLHNSQNFLKIVERLGCLQQYFNSNKNIASNSLIKFISSKIKPFLYSLHEREIWKQGLPEEVRNLDADSEEYKQAKKGLVHRLSEGSIFEYYRTNDPKIR